MPFLHITFRDGTTVGVNWHHGPIEMVVNSILVPSIENDVYITFIGQSSAGKSTCIDRLLGNDSATPSTAAGKSESTSQVSTSNDWGTTITAPDDGGTADDVSGSDDESGGGTTAGAGTSAGGGSSSSLVVSEAPVMLSRYVNIGADGIPIRRAVAHVFVLGFSRADCNRCLIPRAFLRTRWNSCSAPSTA